MQNQLIKIGHFSVLVLASFLLFYGIDTPPIRIWDEAIYANNAIEMAINGDLLVLKNDGQTTLYNTKPPLVIWMQSICIRLFGINEFAIRLPSALATLLTVTSLLIFSSKVLNLPLVGIIAGLTLMLSGGYFRVHVAKTGDLDAVLTMFTTFFSLLYISFLLLPKSRQSNAFIYGSAFLVVLGFFSKSFAVFLPLPGLFIATIASSKRKILVNKHLYASAFFSIILILGYYLFREYLEGGYLNKVYESEIKRLFSNVMPWHNHPFSFYFDNWFSRSFFYPFVYMLFIVPFLLFVNLNDRLKKFIIYALIWSISYFLIISFPVVKLEWYNAPLYPIFSLLVGLVIFFFIRIAQEKGGRLLQLVGILVIVLIYINPLKNSINSITHTPKLLPQEMAGNFMRILHENNPEYNDYTVIQQVKWIEHQDQTKFYQKAYNYESDYRLKIKQYLSEISVRDIILTCQKNKMDSINYSFNVSILKEDDNCKLLQIISNK